MKGQMDYKVYIILGYNNLDSYEKPNSGDRLLFWIVIWEKKSGKTFDPPIHMPSSKVTSFFVSKPSFIQWKFRPWVSDGLFDLQMAGVPLIYTIISSKNH